MLASRLSTVVAAAACILAATAGTVAGKRAAPGQVEPITIRGMTYSAPADAMGFVVATNASSGRELWRQRIYTIRYDRTLEQDVQDVFITSLKRRGNALLITNERGEHFVIDLSTRKVRRESDRNT